MMGMACLRPDPGVWMIRLRGRVGETTGAVYCYIHRKTCGK